MSKRLSPSESTASSSSPFGADEASGKLLDERDFRGFLNHLLSKQAILIVEFDNTHDVVFYDELSIERGL